MKKLLATFAVFVVCAFMLSACGIRNTPTHDDWNSVELDTANFWRYLNINIVHVNENVGTRLQFFSEVRGATFSNVVVTYSAFAATTSALPETRLMTIEQNGMGQTLGCRQAFPRIIQIRGRVEYRH